MAIKLVALQDLDRTTGPTPKGSVFEVPDSDADGVKVLVAAGYVKLWTPEEPAKAPKDK